MIKLDQTYTETPEINSLLITIESHNQTLKLLPPSSPKHLENLRRASLLNSALYSARIEGNMLTEDTISNSRDTFNKLEVQNLLDTYTWLDKQTLIPSIDTFLLKELHQRCMHNLNREAGHFRIEQSAIFNSAGVAIYLTPPPHDIPKLLGKWIDNLSNRSIPPLITSAIAHFQFEKIHPFLDGNGRVGRLISKIFLKQNNYDLNGLLTFEKQIEKNRSIYYDTLAIEKRDITAFVTFFLSTLKESGELALKALASQASMQNELLPRRQELLEIIRDHDTVSFDFLHRRFMKIPESTLRYDLLQLARGGYIKKLGQTRGAMYQLK